MQVQNNNKTVEQNDALEAYNTFRTARNLFFGLLLAGLIVVQAVFWVVNVGAVDDGLKNYSSCCPLAKTGPDSPDQANSDAASQESNQVFSIIVRSCLRVCSLVLMFAAILYCLVLLIGMKLSLVGRLGGLADTGKAFFAALIVMVLVLPWQGLVAYDIWGTVFSYQELLNCYQQCRTQQGLDLYLACVGYYGRFVGFWLLVLVLVLVAQRYSRSAGRQINSRFAQQTNDSATVIMAPPQNGQ